MAGYNDELIGRTTEIAALREIVSRKKSSFLAVYGRRRVGKTYLIRHVFKEKLSFHLTGIADASMRTQLQNFGLAMQQHFGEFQIAQNWLHAFSILSQNLDRSVAEKKIVFLDELPWFDTPRSGFMPALEHFWNSWASARADVLLIVCGSAASWMIGKLINARGGLHNRITDRIRLQPFTLHECELFFKSKNAVFNQMQMLQLYMVMGGIPFYLDRVDTSESAAQNINRLCFHPDGFLKNEFQNLYASLFKQAENHVQVIEALSKKNVGTSRKDLLAAMNLKSGGSLSSVLTELEESHFIRKYRAFGKESRGAIYQLCDQYSFFYLRWIKAKSSSDQNFWLNGLDTPAYHAWSGYAFEQVCLEHISQIKQALGIQGISTAVGAWQGTTSEQGAQIDLLIDRRDQVINVCEVKYASSDFSIDKKYAENLSQKVQVFKEAGRTKKSIFLTLITTSGLKQNMYSYLIQQTVTLKDLFV